MLPDDVLHDLWTSAVKGLQKMPFIGINEKMFRASSPDLPFGDAEVRDAAAFIRTKGVPALAMRLDYKAETFTVEDHILIVGVTEDALQTCYMKINDGLPPGATMTVLEGN